MTSVGEKPKTGPAVNFFQILAGPIFPHYGWVTFWLRQFFPLFGWAKVCWKGTMAGLMAG